MKLKFKPLLSFIPLLFLPGLLTIHKDVELKNHVEKKQQNNITLLPCNFPSRGIVSGESEEFHTGGVFPILYSNGSGMNLYPSIQSSVVSGNNELILQSDGNLCIYENGVNCWDSGTGGRSTSAHYALWFQSDGNLVLKTGNTVIWASNIYSTCSGSQYAYAVFQSDGNFVVQYPHEFQGSISSTHVDIDSYQLGTTHTNGGLHNSNHKIQ